MTDCRQHSETVFRNQVKFETAKRGWEAIEANGRNQPYSANIEEFHLSPSTSLSEPTQKPNHLPNAPYLLDRASMQKVAELYLEFVQFCN